MDTPKRRFRRADSSNPGWKWLAGSGAVATVSFALAGFTGWRWPVLVGLLAVGCMQAALAYWCQNRGR
jgi:anti-sigma-K factor RskA